MPPSHEPINTATYEAMGAFRYALRKFLRFSKEFLAGEADLTPEQYEALLALRSSPSSVGMLVGELSERLQVRPHTAVALTNKLLARKLITKERSVSDRRGVHVHLTTAGRRMVDTLAAVHRDEIRERTAEIVKALQDIQGDGPTR